MRLGKVVDFSRLLDREPARTITTLEILETVDRDTGCTGRELEQSRLLLAIPRPNSLPEELDNLVRLRVTTVIRVLLPIIDINLGNTTNQQLKLAFVEHVDQVLRDELVEALLERLELLLNTLFDPPLDHQIDIFLLVLVRNRNVPTIGDKILLGDHAESLVFSREGRVKDIRNVVVQHPLQRPMEIGIHTFHIRQADSLSENHLVQSANEEGIQESPVEDSQTDNPTNELEVVEMLRVDAGVGVDLKRVVVVRRVLEQAVERVEHLVREEEEELARETAVIETILAVELDHQPFLQIGSRLPRNFRERILENVRSPDLDVTLPRHDPHSRLRAEVDELPPEVSLVLRDVLVQR